MNNKILKSLNVLLIAFILSAFFTGCGYRPASHYAKKEIAGKIYVNLEVNLSDPKNSVLIKDALNELLVNKLNAKLVHTEEEADTLMNISLGSVGLSEQSYGDDGYAKLYRAGVSIAVDYQKKGKSKQSLSVSGYYDFSIDDGSSTISETKRFEAIKTASSKALDEVISKLAVQTFKKNAKKSSK